MIERPSPGEYAEYFHRYISLVPEGDVVEILGRQIGQTRALLEAFGEEGSKRRYAPDKWSVREVVGHLSDTERIFVYRCLRFSRNDATPRAGFEQDDFVRTANFDHRALKDLLDEYASVRQASLSFFRSLDEEALDRKGVASGNQLSVRSVPFIVAGHELHHRKIIQDRYGR